jgi:polyhydroxyalkanoate synthase
LNGLFSTADAARRLQGLALESLGFAPRTTPSRHVAKTRAGDLRAYQPASAGRPALLIVPAPIKRPYIWDIAPGASAVARLLSSGLQVYLLEWYRPQPGDEAVGLEHYAERAIRVSLDAIRAETGEAKAFLAGHSLGGTLAAVFASLHPHRVRGLVELEGPMAFEGGRLEAAARRGPAPQAVTRVLGNVPGSFLDVASARADPYAFQTEPLTDAIRSSASGAARRLHWRVRRWTLDESPMTRRLFEEVDQALYRENRFAEGRLRVGGRVADPRAIEAPILAVLDRRSRIVPPSSIEAYRTCTQSTRVQLLEYAGDTGVVMQHVGVLVGPNAHAHLWPRICSWIRDEALALG